MFERFSGPARSVVALAHEEARRLNHRSIGTEHILLGLIREHDGMAGQVLEARQVELVVRARAEGITWEAIGAAIATTRQGAFNRFGALVQRYEVAGLLGEVAEDTDL